MGNRPVLRGIPVYTRKRVQIGFSQRAIATIQPLPAYLNRGWWRMWRIWTVYTFARKTVRRSSHLSYHTLGRRCLRQYHLIRLSWQSLQPSWGGQGSEEWLCISYRPSISQRWKRILLLCHTWKKRYYTYCHTLFHIVERVTGGRLDIPFCDDCH